MKRRKILALLSISAVLVGPSVPHAAGGAPRPAADGKVAFGNLPAKYRARMAAQDKARTAANRIRSTVEQTKAPGFTGIELRDGGVRLWYQGALPATVKAAVTTARSTAPVEVHAAKYSLAQLATASDKLVAYMKSHPGGPAHRVSALVDGSGLEVGVDAPGKAKGSAVTAALPAVGVPTRTVAEAPIKPAGRYDDYPEYWGGGKIAAAGLSCSAGFGVTVAGRRFLLTAGHCGYPGQGWWNGNGTRFIGTATHENVSADLLMIEADAGNRIFSGSPTSSVNMGVGWWDWAYTGEELCSSGAVSGIICGHVIEDAGNSSYCYPDHWGNYECYTGLVRSEQEDGAEAMRHGDSGGPVFLPLQSGAVIAKGIMSGWAGPDLYWQDFATANQLWGITPIT
jgi:hypothetical protein